MPAACFDDPVALDDLSARHESWRIPFSHLTLRRHEAQNLYTVTRDEQSDPPYAPVAFRVVPRGFGGFWRRAWTFPVALLGYVFGVALLIRTSRRFRRLRDWRQGRFDERGRIDPDDGSEPLAVECHGAEAGDPVLFTTLDVRSASYRSMARAKIAFERGDRDTLRARHERHLLCAAAAFLAAAALVVVAFRAAW